MNSVIPPVAEKPRYVTEMFGRIAGRYDLMNTLMTLGHDSAWRRQVATIVTARVERANARTRERANVLDVGTGTGRLAQAVLDAEPAANVVGIDFTPGMLRVAPRHVHLSAADALKLPFADEQFDAVISGFLVRNLADVDEGVAEQIRVLRPGGVLAILETTPGPTGRLWILYRFYFRYVVPLVGRLIAGDATAYTYLPESTLTFLEPSRLANILQLRGLREVVVHRLALGSVAITLGQKPAPRSPTQETEL